METAKVHSDEFQQFQKITHCLYTELVDKKTSHFLKKKMLFKFKKNSKGTLLFQNFKSYIFAFLTIFDFKSFGGVL